MIISGSIIYKNPISIEFSINEIEVTDNNCKININYNRYKVAHKVFSATKDRFLSIKHNWQWC